MKKSTKKHIVALIAAIAVIAASAGIGKVLGLMDSVTEIFKGINISAKTVISLVVMIAFVIGVEKLIILVLALFRNVSKRLATLITIIQSSVTYIGGLVIICWGLSMLGVSVSTIVASVGIMALVIGFGAESLIEDTITGLFMLFENQYNVGDIMEIGGFRGTVTSIGIRITCITDPGGNIKIINNSKMQNILNRSDKTSRSVCEFSIPYGTDIEEMEKMIPEINKTIYDAHTDVMKAEPEYLGISELGESAIVLKFVVDVDEKNIFSVQRIMNRDYLVEFSKRNIEVPFPQLDVHQR
ncbi:MAG: mechanosensitive ion channel [Eubacteriales bacterium]|nr:mechanosensitive ion channel [Eubacteriales bacterium]